MGGLVDILERVVERYNRYRSPEATARVVAVRDGTVEVEFRGSFCFTCGVVDWIEDLVYEAEDLGLKLRLVSVRDVGELCKLAVFSVEGLEGSR
ncbi:MAG: hypothetical protein GXO23_02010 [Crenarchaeota archaeon]|nr:hypothetical protein [Thermoproteota archaeon]